MESPTPKRQGELGNQLKLGRRYRAKLPQYGMSTRRKKRRASERRLAKVSRRTPITIWTIIIIVLVALAVGIARIMK